MKNIFDIDVFHLIWAMREIRENSYGHIEFHKKKICHCFVAVNVFA